MIDTHSHIYGPEYDDDRDVVVQRARQAGVERILLPNINKSSIEPMLSLCRSFPSYCYPMMGLHPEDVADDYSQVLDHMEELLKDPAHPYIAIGEVGLDFYWDASRSCQQIDAFARQIEWAAHYKLPLVIHSRSAHAELVQIIRSFSSEGLTGVFHCFAGTLPEAQELLSFDGFVLGIGGVSTFKKSLLPEVLQAVPLHRIVLETDSPYLAPVPYRGKRNEPAYITEIMRKMAEIYNVSPQEVGKVTNANVRRVFSRMNW
jgi:TatD DNase family protein